MKSTKAQNHSNKLRNDRERALIQIGKYQNQIDIYTTKMTNCEKRIGLFRNRIKVQQEDIRNKL